MSAIHLVSVTNARQILKTVLLKVSEGQSVLDCKTYVKYFEDVSICKGSDNHDAYCRNGRPIKTVKWRCTDKQDLDVTKTALVSIE